MIELERFAYTPHGSFGRLRVGDKTWSTVELPWKGNAPRESCIPEGVYSLAKRESPVVQRSSGGEFAQGWEVVNVPGRTFIMIHPGNTIDDLLGCIAPGTGLGFMRNKWSVTSSRIAFREFMQAMDAETDLTLRIYQYRPQYP